MKPQLILTLCASLAFLAVSCDKPQPPPPQIQPPPQQQAEKLTPTQPPPPSVDRKRIESDFDQILERLDFNPHLRFDFRLGDNADTLHRKRDVYTDEAESRQKSIKKLIDDLKNQGFGHCDALDRMVNGWFRAYRAMVEDDLNRVFYSRYSGTDPSDGKSLESKAEQARQDESGQLQTMNSYHTAITQCKSLD